MSESRSTAKRARSNRHSDTDGFAPNDDGLHVPNTDSFYETETWWFSFFAPERAIGGWLYASIRQHAGVTAGGAWMWDDAGPNPWDAPFFQQFSHLKPPTSRGPERMEFATGMTVEVLEPGMSYRLGYDDRHRFTADLRFDGLERPVPLRHGAPPYPKAAHYDQTGRVVGSIHLDGEVIDIDCYAMRDRSWGPRGERGRVRVGYTWAANEDVTVLTYTSGSNDGIEKVHSGYLRRDGEVSQLTGGRRVVRRDPSSGWVTGLELDVTDELGRGFAGSAEALSRLILPGATGVCTNTLLRWNTDGAELYGEDQDVWSLNEIRALRHRAR